MTSATLTKADLLSKFKENDDEIGSDTLGLEKGDDVELSYSKFSHLSGLSVFNSDSRKTSPDSGTSGSYSHGNSNSNNNNSHQNHNSAQNHSSPFLRKIQMSVSNIEIDSFPHRAMESIHEDPRSAQETRENIKKNEKMATSARPEGSIPHRKASVKVSLTPAQRVEKRPGLRTRNALDDFEIHEKIGRGAYADVYRATNIKTRKVVAIKQISLDRDYNASALMGEIDLLKILRHRNIVKYHGFVKTSASLNVFLEFCAGGSLRQIYKKQGHGFGESQIVSYVAPILHGLQYLHEQGVVHRDVKAANVLLTGAGEVKLADFGVATKVSTSHNTVVGTPNWMAPETVLGGDGICTASDVWSLGATIIELYTTNPPYHDLNPMATLHAIGTDEHPQLPAGLSAVAQDFLLECFQKQSNLRVSAKMLLRHRWVSPARGARDTNTPLGSENITKENKKSHYGAGPADLHLNPEAEVDADAEVDIDIDIDIDIDKKSRTTQYVSQSQPKPVETGSSQGAAHDPSILSHNNRKSSGELTPATPVSSSEKVQEQVSENTHGEAPPVAYSRAELLARFREEHESSTYDDYEEEAEGPEKKQYKKHGKNNSSPSTKSRPLSAARMHDALRRHMDADTKMEMKKEIDTQTEKETKMGSDEGDPFFALAIPDFPSSELEIQQKTASVLAKLQARAATCRRADGDALRALEKTASRTLHLVKTHSAAREVFVRDHGILTVLELLENAPNMQDRFSSSSSSSSSSLPQSKIWHHVLATLNHVLAENTPQIENFALLGGIPVVTRFGEPAFARPVRAHVVRFVRILRSSEKALLMFVSSGGLRVLARFLEEDFDTAPEFALVAVHCIHDILARGLTRFKSDMCRVLAKHGLVFWFAVLLGRLARHGTGREENTSKISETSEVSPDTAEATIDRILAVFRYFARAEPKVRVSIASADLVRLLVRVHGALSFARQNEILRFLRALSCVSELLRPLHTAGILEFYVSLLRQYTPAHPQYKEVVNIVGPSLYNCCSLNHARERELAMLGAVPLLRDLCRINLPFRQFLLPLLCELVYCDDESNSKNNNDATVRALLLKHDIPTIYYNLLVDPYWHYNVMDSLLHWAAQDASFCWLESTTAQSCLVAGFMMHKVSNLEAALENYLELMAKNERALVLLARDAILENILAKLTLYRNAPAAKLSLLRILHALVMHAADVNKLRYFRVLGPVKSAMAAIVSTDSSVLAKDLASRVVQVLETRAV